MCLLRHPLTEQPPLCEVCSQLAKSLPEQNAEKKTLTASKFIANSSPLGNIGNKVGMRERECVCDTKRPGGIVPLRK
jgi:hypothetical protein